jgi:hypothetical protein
VTKLNVRALDALARAPMPPKVTVDAAVKTYTTLIWKWIPGSDAFRLVRRRTDESGWQERNAETMPAIVEGRDIPTFDYERQIEGIRGDDWLFGIAACAGEYCSPVSSAVPGGAFEPLAKE